MTAGPEEPGCGVVGIVLAGGRGRRMGGVDKPLLTLGGHSLLQRLVARLRPQVDALALSANGDPARFAAAGLPVLSDPLPGALGPLAGVLAGLRWARQSVPPARLVLSVPGDTPFVPLDLARRLLSGGQGGLAYAASAGRPHPAVALWPVALADRLAAAIEAGQRRVLDWVERQGGVAVPFEDDGDDPFFNINTPAELALAEIRAARACNGQDGLRAAR